MKYKILPRRLSLLIYNDDSINYDSSCQININGTKATIDTVNGRDFFKFLHLHGRRVFAEELGLTEIGAAVAAPMLRKIEQIPGINVDVDPNKVYVGDIPLYWIRITFK